MDEMAEQEPKCPKNGENLTFSTLVTVGTEWNEVGMSYWTSRLRFSLSWECGVVPNFCAGTPKEDQNGQNLTLRTLLVKMVGSERDVGIRDPEIIRGEALRSGGASFEGC